jgi:hypothetical protein
MFIHVSFITPKVKEFGIVFLLPNWQGHNPIN